MSDDEAPSTIAARYHIEPMALDQWDYDWELKAEGARMRIIWKTDEAPDFVPSDELEEIEGPDGEEWLASEIDTFQD